MAGEPQKILVRAPNWVGDLVMATAALSDLRRACSKSRITLLLKPGRDQVVAGGDYFDDILFDSSRGSLAGLWKTAAMLRRERFDLAILFPDSLRAAVLAWLARIPRRVGYRRNLRGGLLTDPVDYPGPGGAKSPEPMTARFGRLLGPLGIEGGGGRPRLCITAGEEERWRERRKKLGLEDGEPLVGLNPGAAFGSSKMWPPDRFARVGDGIAEKFGARTVILVGPGEEPIARELEAAMKRRPISTAADPVPLDVLKPLVRDLKLLVTTDTGTRHYAVAFHIPVVVVMGPTDPRYTAVNLEETEVVRRDVPCGPCHLKTCPIDHRCMRGISPEEVLERIERLDRRLGIFGK
ncbi:MAG: lipopolysaccharide heptosyltransferase II [Planctomycetes bacterium]|nr:lipopolysaccharide heptosyltransferase II [Planctomycetota bacterium]